MMLYCDPSKAIRAAIPAGRITTAKRFSQLTGGMVWDVRRDGAYLTGGYCDRQAAKTIANLFRGREGK